MKLIGYVSLAKFPHVEKMLSSVRYYYSLGEIPLQDREKGVVAIIPKKKLSHYPEIATEYEIVGKQKNIKS
jgi:hypothetical protein